MQVTFFRDRSDRLQVVVALLIFSLSLFAGLTPPASAVEGAAEGAVKSAAEAATESEARLSRTVKFLSSDELEGRGVGTKGLDLAAKYLAEGFAKLGLKTELFDGTPFQRFEVNTSSELGPQEHNTLALIGPPKQAGGEPQRIELKLGESFNPLATGGDAKFDAPLVLVGYGITAKKPKYDDYAGIDVKGKVVVIIRKEPQQEDEHSQFNGKQASQHAPFVRKIANAFEHGAAAVIFVNDSLELKNSAADTRKQLGAEIEILAAKQAKFNELDAPTPDETAKFAKEIATQSEAIAALAKQLAGSPDGILTFHGAGDDSSHKKMPVLFAKREIIDKVVKASLGKDLATIESEIDADLQPRSAELTGWTVSGETDIVRKKAEVKNVIAVLEGEGPLADETIVVGAHYDHLGFGGPGSLAPWTTEIHNGADDNASGAATLLEVAQRLAASDTKPKHRIVFIAFTGEERGLLGSAYYVRNPRFGLEKTIAMFNLDMVGRLSSDSKLMVYGTGTANQFDPLVEEMCKKYGFKLTKHPGGFGPSDHSSFYAKKIPVLHLFTGTHSDYHRPSDDFEKLNIPGMRRVADMLVEIVRATDQASTPPQYVELKQMEAIGGGDSDRPYFGSIPDYSANGEGLALTGVSPGGPADKAGLKGGDVIVQFGESKIAGIEDFDSALRKHQIGDKVKVLVKRGSQEVPLEVTLGRRSR
jgi:di/tripeptidase